MPTPHCSLLLAVFVAAFLPLSSPAAEGTVPKGYGTAELEEVPVHVAVHVMADETDKAAFQIDGPIEKSLEGTLTELGYATSGAEPDFEVDVMLKTQVAEQSGHRRTYEGIAQAALLHMADTKELAAQEFRVRGPNELGKQKALWAMSRELTSTLSAWVVEQTTRATTGLQAAHIHVRLPEGRAWELHVVLGFIADVGALPGVDSVVLMQDDPSAGTGTFRVVHTAPQTAEKLLAAIVAIDGLKLVPVKP